jgi:O-methyltransferase
MMNFGRALRSGFERITRTLGYRLVPPGFKRRGKRPSAKHGYEKVLPTASYAPWRVDAAFQNVFAITSQFSRVDEYRCYELWQLVTESKKTNGALLEVGVWRGGTGGLIAKKADLEGIKDKVYLCDTFVGIVKAGAADSEHKGGEYANTSKEFVEELVTQKLQLSNVVVLKGIFPDETGHLIKDSEFRFCHIDVDVYQSAKDIMEWIWPRMSVGGVFVCDDYGFPGAAGVTKFANEERQKEDRIVIHNLNGHAIILKIS